MVSQECLNRCREELLNRRTKAEGEIIKLGKQVNSVQRKDFDPQSGLFDQELRKEVALCDTEFARLKKINVRISEIDKGTFLGVCPECGEDMEEKVLEENPLRTLCVNCQKAENDRR